MSSLKTILCLLGLVGLALAGGYHSHHGKHGHYGSHGHHDSHGHHGHGHYGSHGHHGHHGHHVPYRTDCDFTLGNVSLNYPLLLEKEGQRYRFLPVPADGKLVLKDGQQVVATCQSQSFGFCTDKFGSVQLLCKAGKPFVAFQGKAVPYCQNKYKLACKGPVVQHYPYDVRGCDYFGVMLAYVNHVRTSDPRNNLVKLATFCYDTVQRKVNFAHFKALHSVFLDLQYVTNVGIALNIDVNIVKGTVRAIDLYNLGPEPAQQTGEFTVGLLAPAPLLGSQYVTPFSNSRLNRLSVFRSAVGPNGNWARLLELLKNLSNGNVLDVYTGVTNGPRDVEPNAGVPTYVYAYVQVQSPGRTYRPAVVFLVNVPGLNAQSVRPYVFGSDVFRSVQWLQPLSPGRTNPDNGYLFVLTPFEAQQLVPEFPRIQVPQPQGTTTTAASSATTPTATSTTTRNVRRTTPNTRRTTFGPFPCKQVDPQAPQFRACAGGRGSVWNGRAPAQVPAFQNVADLLNDEEVFEQGGLLRNVQVQVQVRGRGRGSAGQDYDDQDYEGQDNDGQEDDDQDDDDFDGYGYGSGGRVSGGRSSGGRGSGGVSSGGRSAGRKYGSHGHGSHGHGSHGHGSHGHGSHGHGSHGHGSHGHGSHGYKKKHF